MGYPSLDGFCQVRRRCRSMEVFSETSRFAKNGGPTFENVYYLTLAEHDGAIGENRHHTGRTQHECFCGLSNISRVASRISLGAPMHINCHKVHLISLR